MAFDRLDSDATARDRAYTAMLAHISDVIAVLDQDGIVRFKSANVREIFGWDPEKLVGRSAFANVHPDDVEHIRQRFFALLQEPEQVISGECRYLHADGTYRWMRFSAANKLDEPILQGILLNYRDVTEERRVQERFRVTFEYAPVGMFLVDDQNRIVEANRAAEELLGYEEGSLIGMNGRDLIHPDDLEREPIEEVTEQVLSQQTPWETDNKFRTKSGAYIDVHVRVGGISLEDRSASHIVQFYDITRRVQAEERVKALLEEKELLLREVHHRIKNDLSLVYSLLSTQAQTVGKEAAAALQEAGSRVGVMARVYDRLQEVKGFTEVDVSTVIGGLVEDLRRSVVPDGISIRTDVPSISVPSRLGVSLGIIANELIANAVKYAFPPQTTGEAAAAEIVITVQRAAAERYGAPEENPAAEHTLYLAVGDTGNGFPADVLSGERSSYGLMITQALVDQHQGTIVLENDGGATVRITVPIPAAESPNQPSADR